MAAITTTLFKHSNLHFKSPASPMKTCTLVLVGLYVPIEALLCVADGITVVKDPPNPQPCHRYTTQVRTLTLTLNRNGQPCLAIPLSH